MEKSFIGVIGLGVMGRNLAENIEEKGFSVSVYNRSTDKVDAFLRDNEGKNVRGAHSPEARTKRFLPPKRP